MTTWRVALDVCALNPEVKEHAARGIGRYVSALKGFFDSDEQSQGHISFFDSVEETKKSLWSPLVEMLPLGRATVRQQLLYPLQLQKHRENAKFLHFPAHMDAPTWSAIPTIVTVLDLIPLIFKDLYAPEQGSWRFNLARALELRAMKNATLILAISKTTSDDVQRLLGIPASKIVITPLGVADHFFSSPEPCPPLKDELTKRCGLIEDEPFFMYVGGIDQRKNIPGLIEAFARFLSEKKIPKLLLIGKIETDKNFHALSKQIEAKGLTPHVRCLGYLPDSDVQSLMRASVGFVFPSLYEGFGLPPLEALASGALVISSDRSCLPEVLGKAPLFINPQEPESIFSRLKEALSLSRTERDSRRDEGQLWAKKFRWEETGRLTREAYEFVSNQ